ncbi:MAG: AraC family transcriptional regulator [Aquabacterium sp.]
MVDPSGSARMWLPRMSLAQCVKCIMVRDTRMLPGGRQHAWTWLPASPCCALTWFFEGCSEQMDLAGGDARVIGRYEGLVFAGSHRRPTAFRYPEPVHGFMILFMPDALSLLTGMTPSDWTDRIVPAQDVIGQVPWLMALCEEVSHAADDDARVQCIEAVLDPMWQAVRPTEAMGSHYFEDWMQGLSLRASQTGLGRSIRQVERRIKQWTGHPLRELRGISRSERTFMDALAAEESGELNWATLAIDTGHADQSHLSRQSRRLTGFAPEEFRRRIREDEGFWAYRLWGFSEARRPVP